VKHADAAFVGGHLRLQKAGEITQIENWHDAEALAKQACADKRSMLTEKARGLLARGLKANLEAGRTYNKLKPLFVHGDWIPFLEAEGALVGLSLRTLQEYMRRAHEADEVAKKEDPAFFPPATDFQAQAVKEATRKARASVVRAGKAFPKLATSEPNWKTIKPQKKRIDGIYRVPLVLTGDQKTKLDALRNSSNWPAAAKVIVSAIDGLFVRFGIVNTSEAPQIQHEKRPNKKVTILRKARRHPFNTVHRKTFR
jgi:hypothetical protein